jgi:hypothetical protein
LLATAPIIKAQPSLAKIYDMTRTWNTNLWDEQRRLQQLTDRWGQSNSGSNQSSSTTSNVNSGAKPPLRQYPITTTDFSPFPNRIVPDLIVNEIPNLTAEQRETLRTAYHQTLTFYEAKTRKNNLAHSFALIVGLSMQVVSGKPLVENEMTLLINYYNSTLANIPQFKNLSGRDKQILHESLILNAATIGALYTQGVQQHNPVQQLEAIGMAKSVLKNFVGMNV